MRFSLLAPVVRAWSRAAGAVLLVAGIAAAVAGCSIISGIPDVGRVELTIAPNPLFVGQTTTAAGIAYTKGGDVIRNSRRAVTYSSSQPNVASVNPTSGQILGRTPGITVITGESGGRKATVDLVVQYVPARTVLILDRNPTYRVGTTTTIRAIARDSVGNTLANRIITFRSSDETVLTLNADIVTPRAAGTATIYATVDNGAGVGSVSDSVTAKVTAAP